MSDGRIVICEMIEIDLLAGISFALSEWKKCSVLNLEPETVFIQSPLYSLHSHYKINNNISGTQCKSQ